MSWTPLCANTHRKRKQDIIPHTTNWRSTRTKYRFHISNQPFQERPGCLMYILSQLRLVVEYFSKEYLRNI